MNTQRSPATAPRAHKRGHGEGSIYQRPDGRWVGTIMLGLKPDGKPDRPKVYGKTRGEVQKQLAALRRKADEGTRAEPARERQTVAAYLDDWLEAARTSTRPQTWDGYRQIVRKHIAPVIGQFRLSALRPDAIQRLYAGKLTELAPSTVAKIHIVLHRALAMAVRWNYLPRNPADAVDRLAVPRRDRPTLEPADLLKLVEQAAAEGDRPAPRQHVYAARQWTTLWTLAMHTGCREGELLGLAWSDVDLECGTITVRRTLVATRNQTPRFGEPKSATSRRTVALPTEAVQALRAHKARQAQERLAAPAWADFGLVFTSHVGTPLLRRNVLRAFKSALRRAGLPESTRFHDLRHAHATLLLRAGVPLKVASGRLGHNSIAITGDLYQHVARDMDADAAERAARALRGV